MSGEVVLVSICRSRSEHALFVAALLKLKTRPLQEDQELQHYDIDTIKGAKLVVKV